MTDILAAVVGLLLRVLVGMGAMVALLVPVLAIVGLRLLWERGRHHQASPRHLVDWFGLPEGYAFHRGHAWAKRELPSVAVVGMDDFAQQLVGPLAAIDLPRRGDTIQAGQRAWRLRADSETIDMVAPITGKVIAVNELLESMPDLANKDPYGRGWFCAVQLPKDAGGFDELLSGAGAHAWMAQVTHDLEMTFTPQLGHVLQDGGVPVHGFARAIDESNWGQVARDFLSVGCY